MAYSGFLLKVGNYKVPHGFIKAESYSVTLSGQDLDSYEDANGELQRTALKNVKPKVEFETKNMMKDDEFWAVFSKIREQYIDTREKKANCTFYVPELHTYITHPMYMPDITFSPYLADDDVLIHKSVRLAFISYGKEV